LTVETTQADVLEIERKFLVNDSIKQLCELQCETKRIITMSDSYFDTKSFHLTTKDYWLRERNGAWELKAPIDFNSQETKDVAIDQYNEITDLGKISCTIRSVVGGNEKLSTDIESENFTSGTFMDWLQSNAIEKFLQIGTTRTRYSLLFEDISIDGASVNQRILVDLDEVVNSDNRSTTPWAYRIGEIELAHPIAHKNYAALMNAIFVRLNIDPSPVRGKVLEYLRVHRKEHYAALAASGQLASKGIL
jgi:uncharacterized protein YjbK